VEAVYRPTSGPLLPAAGGTDALEPMQAIRVVIVEGLAIFAVSYPVPVARIGKSTLSAAVHHLTPAFSAHPSHIHMQKLPTQTLLFSIRPQWVSILVPTPRWVHLPSPDLNQPSPPSRGLEQPSMEVSVTIRFPT